MPCFHPHRMTRFVDDHTGEVLYRFDKWQGLFLESEDQFPVPCGKCIGCRLDYSRAWADRMMLELDHSKTAIFVTLTYDDAHLPDKGSLSKRDAQTFLKRLRYYFSDREVRYYLAGEYGDHTHRCHLHAILFGLSLADFPDRKVVKQNFAGQTLYSSEFLARIWTHGFVSLSDVSWSTCAYVSRYVTKKVSADYEGSDFNPHKLGIEPEFALMSRRPGIGGYYHLDHPDCFDSLTTYVRNPNDVPGKDILKRVQLPRYVFNHLEEINPALYQKYKEERAKYSKDLAQLELDNTSLDVLSYNHLKESQLKYDKAKRLKRKEL